MLYASTMPITIIIGTNRPHSLSAVVAHHCAHLFERKGVLTHLLNLQELPEDFAFSALYANKKKNSQVNTMIAHMDESVKYLFVVPQYNGSFPGVLKTFIDAYASPKIFKGKKAALIGVSKGYQGNLLGLSHLGDILYYLGMTIYPVQPKLANIVHPDIDLVKKNPRYIAHLEEQASGFIDF
ncbi:MAG: NAD(P)H-dependent oxidoreductase [Bacteroidota bacterium]